LDDSAGRTRLDLCWAPSVVDLVGRAAQAVLAGPTSAQGTPLLPDESAAAVVGWALSVGALDVEVAEHATDAVEAWLDAPSPDGVWRMLAAIQEHRRTGDPALLAAAERQLEALTDPAQTRSTPPGVGLVGTQVVLAVMAAGRDARPALAQLNRVGGAHLDLLGRAELSLVLGTRFGGLRDTGQADDLLRGAWAAVGLLGAGLRGRAYEDQGLVVRARAVTLCALLPGVGDPFLHTTAQSTGSLARSAGNRLLAELSDAVDVGPAHPDARTALLWIGLAGADLAG